MPGTLHSRGHGAHPHLLPDRRDRPVRRLLRGARLRGAPAHAHPRRGDQRLHGPARRRRSPGADLQPRRRLLRARHRLQPHCGHGLGPRRHALGARRAGHPAGEAALPRARRRQPDLLRTRPGRLPHRAHRARLAMAERRLAVIDVGSDSFRLVVFTSTGAWWKRTDESHQAVRVGEGLEATGDLQPEPMERALEVLELYAHFCRATGIDEVRPVATSAVREARNRDDFLAAARERSDLELEVLSTAEEARYGYLAAVNSTTLSEGVALDLGGGSMQLTRVRDRHAIDARSWRLGAVRMTERFLPDKEAKRKQIKALRSQVREELAGAPWLRDGGRLAGIGGTVRNLAGQYHADFTHVEHVARLALQIWEALGEAEVHPRDGVERELLWAAAMLHDIGTAVDYDDHHKHSRYLILNAGLPGFTPR